MRPFSALILSATLALPLPALAETLSPPVLSVTGTGSVEAVPDLATLSIGVTTQGDTASAALAANSALLEAVFAQLTATGIAARDMQTSYLAVNPNFTGYDDLGAPLIAGYIATNTLMVQVRQIDTLGAVVDAALGSGANTLNGLAFSLADPQTALDGARREAVDDARARAKLLATAAGMTLGRVLSISEAGTGLEVQPAYRAEAAALPLAQGEIALSASVTMVFEINP